MFDSIGFIGAGRITRIMLTGWHNAGQKLPPVYVHDSSAETLAELQNDFPFVHPATLEDTATQALLFVALHPPALLDTLQRCAPHLRHDAFVVSLAPKLQLPALKTALDGFSQLARMNPNAASVINHGYNPIAINSNVPEKTREDLLTLLAPLGATPVVEDALIEAFAVISAMGPTYFWFQFETLRTLAEQFGLPPALARQAIQHMLHGAVDTLFASNLRPEQVMNLVPVHPLASHEEAIQGMLRQSIEGIHAKLRSPL